MQDDCNLVVYDMSTYPGTPTWASGTNGKGTTCTASLATNGVLTINNGATNIYSQTTTPGPIGGYQLVMQNDGNLVIYPPASWSSNTYLNDALTAVCIGVSCGNGQCIGTSGVAVCSCNSGYIGSSCSTCATNYVMVASKCVVNPCLASNICLNGGICVGTTGVAMCTCATGYAGPTCSGCAVGFVSKGSSCIVNPCTGNTQCLNGATCVGTTGAISCICATGYFGQFCAACNSPAYVSVGTTCVVNPCTTGASKCLNGATCVGSTGSLACNCVGGFVGQYCASCPSNYIQTGSTCSAFSGSYINSCSQCTTSVSSLQCSCKNEAGFMQNTILNVLTCNGVLNQIDNDNGNLQCVANYGGSYSQSCVNCNLVGLNLQCSCKNEAGGSVSTSLNLATTCIGTRISNINNINGVLSC